MCVLYTRINDAVLFLHVIQKRIMRYYWEKDLKVMYNEATRTQCSIHEPRRSIVNKFKRIFFYEFSIYLFQ